MPSSCQNPFRSTGKVLLTKAQASDWGNDIGLSLFLLGVSDIYVFTDSKHKFILPYRCLL